MLWGRSGNRCAIETCRKELVMDATETDDESLIGEECHIIANSPDGPRGDASVSENQLNKYDNLILLCRIHHKVIDDQPNTYTVDQMKNIKAKHEKWVRESLTGYDSQKQKDDEVYATFVETWMKLAHIADWDAWTSHILGADQPSLWVDVDKDLSEVCEWIFARIWPKRYPDLEAAFENFRRVCQDFQTVFHEHAIKLEDSYDTEKFYHIREWNKEKYESFYRKYIFHVKLVEDLILELTRSANYICDKVRQFIDPSFRIQEGMLIVTSGPYMDMKWHSHRVEYRNAERIDTPYQGLKQFKKDRVQRDFNFGAGEDTDDEAFKDWYRSLD
jgi:hypothetical protein